MSQSGLELLEICLLSAGIKGMSYHTRLFFFSDENIKESSHLPLVINVQNAPILKYLLHIIGGWKNGQQFSLPLLQRI